MRDTMGWRPVPDPHLRGSVAYLEQVATPNSNGEGGALIPTGINQNPWAHFRRPIDMIFQG